MHHNLMSVWGVGMRLIIIAVLLSVGLMARASTPFKQSLDEKKNVYMQDGVFTGGKAGTGTTLLGIRRRFSAKAKIERVIVDLGDKDAKPSGKNMGYFQASVDARQMRVILDLAQLRSSALSEQRVQDIFRNSPFVKSVEFTLDPEDRAGTLVLNLKRPMRLEVFQLRVNKKPARVVMDMMPAKEMSVKGHL
jgi:hypothetical protein